MRRIMIAAIFLGLGNMLQAQVTTGTVTGKVTDVVTGQVLPYTKVWIETDGGKIFAMCDSVGKYRIDALKPGIYNVYAKYTQYDTSLVLGVNVAPEALTYVDIKMSNKSGTVVDIIWVAPIIDPNLQRIKIPTEHIKQSPNIQNPLALIASYSSEIQMPEGSDQVIIRGSRPGDAVYYIDGVKMDNMSSVPGVSIGSLEAYTGGVPAKYGDTTGGVIILETKSYFDLYNAWLVGQ